MGWWRRLWYFLNRRGIERDLEREMASHRALMTDPRRFGSTLRLREESADVWGWTWIDDLLRDLRYAARVVRRSPAFAAAAITTIALGSGASTAIFSVAYGVSLRPLPYGTLSHLVGVRTREIAIRMSLGASAHVILPAVMKRGLVPVVGGGLIGLAAAAGAARLFESLLFEVEPFDATSFAVGVVLMLVAALVAVLAPARRMLRVDPVVALRAE
jgi:hypothetical protein